MAEGRLSSAGESSERARLKRLLGRAASLGQRARGVSRSGRQADRQAAAYLANLARQVARLLHTVPRHGVPLLRLPQGAGDARGVTHHVLGHALVQTGPTLFMRLLVLGGDGRLRICVVDTTAPGTRVWQAYDLNQPPEEFDFHGTVTALAELLDQLEQALRAEEQRIADRLARLAALSGPPRLTGGRLQSRPAAGSLLASGSPAPHEWRVPPVGAPAVPTALPGPLARRPLPVGDAGPPVAAATAPPLVATSAVEPSETPAPHDALAPHPDAVAVPPDASGPAAPPAPTAPRAPRFTRLSRAI
jgi:hypothetical protein